MQINPLVANAEDVSSLFTADTTNTSSFFVKAYRIGKLIVCNGEITPNALTTIQKKNFLNFDASIAPKVNAYIPITILKEVTNGSSALFSHRMIANIIGELGTPNEGGFNTIGAVTTNTKITFNVTWITN